MGQRLGLVLDGWFGDGLVQDFGLGGFVCGKVSFRCFIVDLEHDIFFGFGVDDWTEFGDGGSKDRGFPFVIKFMIVCVDDFLGHGSRGRIFMVH